VRVHVVGGGLAGLAAAVAVAKAGRHCVLYEAAPQAGGRCRSYRDPVLDRMVDNGTHLVLGVNRQTHAFLRVTGGTAACQTLPARLPFMDMIATKRWTVAPLRLGTGWRETLAALGFPYVNASQTVADRLGRTKSFTRVWDPLCRSILNTPADEASAHLLAQTLRAVIMAGPRAMRPTIFPKGLSAAFVDPAIHFLTQAGMPVYLGRRLTGLTASALHFGMHTVQLAPDDKVVLALPPWAAAKFTPGLPTLPTSPIANVHFLIPGQCRVQPASPFMGITGGYVDWLSVRGDVLSATVSAQANPRPDRIWNDACTAFDWPCPAVPPHRVVIEKRATLRHTPDCVERRLPTQVPGWKNVVLAGDWIRSPWPCTIESAIHSGLRAAATALGEDGLAFA
jgi:hypothetical protein